MNSIPVGTKFTGTFSYDFPQAGTVTPFANGTQSICTFSSLKVTVAGQDVVGPRAGITRARVYQVRQQDPAFAAAWEDAEERAADALETEAWRRAVVGVAEPLVSAGKVVRDDDGQPLAIRRYSDNLLIALLKAHRPDKFKDRQVVEHDIADGLADRLEAARQRALAMSDGTADRLAAPLPRLVHRDGH